MEACGPIGYVLTDQIKMTCADRVFAAAVPRQATEVRTMASWNLRSDGDQYGFIGRLV